MVISHASLVQSGTPGRLDPPKDARRDERIQIVVDGLAGEGGQAPSCDLHDELRIPMLAFNGYRIEYR